MNTWTQINESLVADTKKQRIFLFSRIAALVALLITTGITLMLINRKPAVTMTALETKQESTIPPDVGAGRPASPSIKSLETSPIGDENIDKIENKSPLIAENTEVSSQSPILKKLKGMYISSVFQTDFEDEIDLVRIIQVPFPEVYNPPTVVMEFSTEAIADLTDSYSKWSVGAQLTPVYAYRNIVIPSGGGQATAYYNQNEEGGLAYSGGVHVNYSPRERLSVQSGIYYSKLGMSVNSSVLVSMHRPAGLSNRIIVQ